MEFRISRNRVIFPFFSSIPETRMSRLYSSAARFEHIAALVPVLSAATSSAAREVDVVSWRSRPGSWVERKGVHCVQACGCEYSVLMWLRSVDEWEEADDGGELECLLCVGFGEDECGCRRPRRQCFTVTKASPQTMMLGFFRETSARRSSVCTTDPFVLFSKGITPIWHFWELTAVKMLGMSGWGTCCVLPLLFSLVGYAERAAW